jgi:hypothetical protein
VQTCWWKFDMADEMPLGESKDEGVYTEEYWHGLLTRPPRKDGDRFEHGGQAQALRLAELGLLEPWELAHFEREADEARPRVGTDAEHRGPGSFPDREAVRLWAALQAALGR